MPRHHRLFAAVGLAALIAVVYGNSLRAGFVLDNRALILENPHLRAATWPNVVTIVTHDYWHPLAVNGLYRPLTTLSYLVNYSLLGNADRPFGHHAVNLALHWACAMLTYWLLLRLNAVPLLAALGAGLFAVHPLTTEAVTNIVGRADLLAALSVLTGLACYINAARFDSARRRWLAALAVAAVIGVFSKENAVVLLPLIVAWEVVAHPQRSWPERGRRLAAPTLLLAGIVGLMLGASAWVRANEWVAQTSALDNPILGASVVVGRLTALQVIGFQIWQSLWPATLSADYSYNQIPLVTWPVGASTWVAWLTVVALVATAVGLRRRQPAITFAIVFFVIALLPTANLLLAIGSIRADRFLYLPLIGFVAGIVLGAGELMRTERSRRALVTTLVLAILACGWRTAVRNRDWSDDETLWRSTVVVSPNSAKAQKGYAAALFARGGNHLEAAIAHAERAVSIRPDYIDGLLDLGGYYVARGNQRAAENPTEAGRCYERAVALLRRARRLDRRGQHDFRARMVARGQPRRTIPERGSVPLYRNLAAAYFSMGELERALIANRYARRLDPWAVQTSLDISGLHARRGEWDAAAVALFEIVAIDRGQPDAWKRLTELYQIIEPGTRVLVADGASGVVIDEGSALLRRHRCAAHAELARFFARARVPDIARAARAWIGTHCGSLQRSPDD